MYQLGGPTLFCIGVLFGPMLISLLVFIFFDLVCTSATVASKSDWDVFGLYILAPV